VWRVRGYDVALELDPASGRYKACVPSLPGCHAEGPDRTATLKALAATIEAHGLGVPS